MYKVAVLLAAYNGSKHIMEQLDSIFSQVDVDITVFVSVDFSTDDTESIVESYIPNEKLTILPYGARFGSAGKNFFRLILDVDFSSFDFVSFSDQDDIWDHRKTISAIKAISDKQVSAYSSNVEAFWGDGKRRLISKSQRFKSYDYLFESAGPGCTFVTTVKFLASVKKTLLLNSDSLENVWLHDWLIYSYAKKHGFKWFIDSKSYVLYRQHNNNVVGANFGLGALIYRIKVVLKGEAFTKVLYQANFLNLGDELPIQLLKNNNRISYLRLGLLSYRCRRRLVDQFYFFCLCMVFFLKGKRDD